jgi:hypothetical protein
MEVIIASMKSGMGTCVGGTVTGAVVGGRGLILGSVWILVSLGTVATVFEMVGLPGSTVQLQSKAATSNIEITYFIVLPPKVL